MKRSVLIEGFVTNLKHKMKERRNGHEDENRGHLDVPRLFILEATEFASSKRKA